MNRLVDVYNAVSVAYGLPLGGEDADRLLGAPVLRAARDGDAFDLPGPDGAPDPPRPGEVVWADDAGVTCRAWNWRQGVRTRIREDTCRAVFLLEAIDDGAAAAYRPRSPSSRRTSTRSAPAARGGGTACRERATSA